MAMTKEEYNNKLKRISELSNDNEEVMSIAREIQAELDSYNEKEYYEENQVYDTDGRLWAEKYQEVKKEYRDKFFSTPSEAIENQNNDLKKDNNSANVSFEDLFNNREGAYKH